MHKKVFIYLILKLFKISVKDYGIKDNGIFHFFSLNSSLFNLDADLGVRSYAPL